METQMVKWDKPSADLLISYGNVWRSDGVCRNVPEICYFSNRLTSLIPTGLVRTHYLCLSKEEGQVQ